MEGKALAGTIAAVIDELAHLIPAYMAIEADRIKSDGNVSVCIIDTAGNIYGKMFGGTDKIKGRETYWIAWMKASQVWLTGIRTGEFEKLVFNNEIDEKQFGIRRPDYIGWEGGQPVTLADGTVLAVGFSGFSSSSDLEIVLKAVSAIS